MAGPLTQGNEQVPLSPVVVAYVLLSGQTSAIAQTNILANAPAGIYRANITLQVTATGTSGNLVTNLIYTDDAKAETVSAVTLIGVTSLTQGNVASVIENAAAGNIAYSVTASGTLSPGTFSLYIILERLF